jgi:hypothetical protein
MNTFFFPYFFFLGYLLIDSYYSHCSSEGCTVEQHFFLFCFSISYFGAKITSWF